MRLTKAIEEATPIPANLDFTGTILDPMLVKQRIGEIYLPIPVLTIEDRANLWPMGNDPRVDPAECTGVKTKVIRYPYIEPYDVVEGHFVLQRLSIKANNILALLAKEEIDPIMLQTAVSRYQDEILAKIFGKSGFFSRNLAGFRAINSCRAVLSPDPNLNQEQVGVPKEAMNAFRLDAGDFVLITRSPVLWEGSVLIQRAVPSDDKTIHMNPFVMDLMGADFDGDTAAIFKCPKDPQSIQELSKACGETIREHSKWNAEFLMLNDSTAVDWDNASDDLSMRTGAKYSIHCSIGPEDILDPKASDTLTVMEESGCKSIPDDAIEYAKGISKDKFVETAKDTTSLLIRMKVELGVIGSQTDMLVTFIKHYEPKLLKKALMFKEKLTQALLDSKHGSDIFPTFDITELLNRYGKWQPEEAIPVENAIVVFEHMGIENEVIEPILREFWPLQTSLKQLVSEVDPEFMATRRTNKKFAVDMWNGLAEYIQSIKKELDNEAEETKDIQVQEVQVTDRV